MCVVLYTLFYVVLRTRFYVGGYGRPCLLQINGLGEAEVETTIDAEDNISIFPTVARSRAGSWVSVLADAAFGEDARGLDHDGPAADFQTHQHDPQITGHERTSRRICGRLGFEHAAGRGGAAINQRLAVDHDRLIDSCAEAVSGMRRRARKRALQANRDGRSLGQFRGRWNQRLAGRNSGRARLAIEGQLLRIGRVRGV